MDINIPEDGGVQILPIQWRKQIKFKMDSQDDLDHHVVSLKDITLDGIPGIRHLVSDVILDVLMYMTPRYRQEMIRHVAIETNRVYRLYLSRNPHFTGKVSIYGHSLGSVLAYDVITHRHSTDTMERSHLSQREVDLSDLLEKSIENGQLEGLMANPDPVKYEPLAFSVDKLFGKILKQILNY